MTDAPTIASVLISSGLVALLGAGVGAPIALALASSRTSLVRFVFDACAIGLFALLVGITIWTWLGWFGALAYAAVLTAAVAWSLRNDPVTHRFIRALRPRITPTAVAVGVLVGLAIIPRLRSVNYVAYTGDQGAYVNWANRLARQPIDLTTGWFAGPDVSTFPPLFAVFLSIPARAFGPVHTTSAMLVTGLLLLGVTLRILDQLDARPTVRIASVLLIGWHVHAIWYTNFPLSEALQAPLVLLFLSCCLDLWRAGTDHRPGANGDDPTPLPIAEMAIVTILALALGFNRGTAPLFMAPLLVVLAGTAAPAWRRFGPGVARSCAAALAGFGVTHLFSSSEIRQYYVVDQIGKNLGESGMELLERLQLLSPSVVSVAFIVFGVGAFLALARWLGARSDDSPAAPTAHRSVRWPLPLTACLALVLLLTGTVLASQEIRDQIDRIGRPLAMVALLGLLLPRAVAGARGLAATFAAVTGASMVLIQSSRLGDRRLHSQFLYWDRYLFSELFPMMALLALLAASAVIEAVEARTGSASWARPARLATAAAPIALALAAVLVTAPTVRVMLEDEPNDNAIQLLAGVDAKLGDNDVPVLWGATAGPPTADFGFPNSWHAYGLALESTFDQDVVNIPPIDGPFSPDPILTDSNLRNVAACRSDGRVRVVEWDNGGDSIQERSTDPELEFRRLGTEEVVTPRLNQPHRSRWARPINRLAIYEVQGTFDPHAACDSLTGWSG